MPRLTSAEAARFTTDTPVRCRPAPPSSSSIAAAVGPPPA
jgi:hypothetical protein